MEDQINVNKYLNGQVGEKNEGGRAKLLREGDSIHAFCLSFQLTHTSIINLGSERKTSYPNSDSDLHDQYHTAPKQEQCQEVAGPENGWDWTLIGALPLPREPIHFVSMPCVCLE